VRYNLLRIIVHNWPSSQQNEYSAFAQTTEHTAFHGAEADLIEVPCHKYSTQPTYRTMEGITKVERCDRSFNNNPCTCCIGAEADHAFGRLCILRIWFWNPEVIDPPRGFSIAKYRVTMLFEDVWCPWIVRLVLEVGQ